MSNHENYRNEIKAYIVRAGMTMSEVVEVLADEYGWSSSVPNLSGKLKRGSFTLWRGGGTGGCAGGTTLCGRNGGNKIEQKNLWVHPCLHQRAKRRPSGHCPPGSGRT